MTRNGQNSRPAGTVVFAQELYVGRVAPFYSEPEKDEKNPSIGS